MDDLNAFHGPSVDSQDAEERVPISIGDDLDPDGRLGVLVGGAENLSNALMRRLRCPVGYLPHQPDYGSLLHRFLGRPFNAATAYDVRAEVIRTCMADPRVVEVASLSVGANDSLDAFYVSAEVVCEIGVVQIAGPIRAVSEGA